MIVQVIEHLYLMKNGIFILIFDDGHDPQQEVKLVDEIFPEMVLGTRHVIFDYIVQPSICRILHEFLIVEIFKIKVEFAAYRYSLN